MGILGLFVWTVLMGLVHGSSDCISKNLDVGILVDTSKSITSTTFDAMKEEVIKVVNGLNIGSSTGQVRVAISSFDASPKKMIGLDKGIKKGVVKKAAKAMTFTEGMETDIGKAINSMNAEFKSNQRKETIKVLVVFTDGDSVKKADVKKEAEAARKADIITFVVAVGVQENKEQSMLTDIAGDKTSITRLEDGKILTRVKNSQVNYCKVCRDVPADLVLAVDSSRSITTKNWKEIVEFLPKLVDEFDIGDGDTQIKVGAVQFAYDVYPQTVVKLSGNRVQIEKDITDLPFQNGYKPKNFNGEWSLKSLVWKVVDYAKDNMMASAPARTDSTKIIILITDGITQNINLAEKSAIAARKDGILIFALGVGSEFYRGRSVDNTALENLRKIVGKEDKFKRFYTVRGFDKLNDLATQIRKQICDTIKSN